MTEATGQPAAPEPDDDHYEDCPAHPDSKSATEPCRCAAINAENDAYYDEPSNMAALENGGGTPVW